VARAPAARALAGADGRRPRPRDLGSPPAGQAPMSHLLSRLSEPASPRKLAAFRIALGLYVAFLYTSESWWLLLAIGGKPNRLTNTALPAAAEAFLDAHLAAPAVVVTGVAALIFALGA